MSATLMVPEGDAGRSCAEEMISHEEKVEAFKSDPQLMKAASNFVTEVLEKAKEEVARRSHQNKVEKIESENVGSMRFKRGGPWHSRARGFVTRLFAAICGCNSVTEVKA